MTMELGLEEVVEGSADGALSLEKVFVESIEEIENPASKLEEVGYKSRGIANVWEGKLDKVANILCSRNPHGEKFVIIEI